MHTSESWCVAMVQGVSRVFSMRTWLVLGWQSVVGVSVSMRTLLAFFGLAVCVLVGSVSQHADFVSLWAGSLCVGGGCESACGLC